MRTLSEDVDEASSTSTVEDTLSPVFATLTPRNAAACRAFSNVVEATIERNEYNHQSAFLDFSGIKVPLEQAVRYSEASFSEAEMFTATDTESEVEPRKTHHINVYRGCYTFCLDIAPIQPALGWQLGTGRWGKMGVHGAEPQGGVDLLLDTVHSQGVRGKHASFVFDRESGILMLRSRQADPYGVRLDTKYFTLQQRALNRPTCSVQFGQLEYTFSYRLQRNSDDEGRFQMAKTRFFGAHLNSAPPAESTSATPSEHDIRIGDWTLHKQVGQGAFGTVEAASHRHGTVVALKSFRRRDKHSASQIKIEISAAERLQAFLSQHDTHSRIIRLCEVIYQSGNPSFNPHVNSNELVCILYTPLARGTFNDLMHILPHDTVGSSTKAVFFKQILEGLAMLHSHGWLHRDLKPANLGIRSFEPPLAVILDMGCARNIDPPSRYLDPKEGHYGTVSYLAPEMEAEPYDQSVDIWALGLVGHDIFIGPQPWARSPFNAWRRDKNPEFEQDVAKHKDTVHALASRGYSTVHDLIAGMILWEPRERLSAEEAMAHPFLRGVETNKAGTNEGATIGSKRKAQE